MGGRPSAVAGLDAGVHIGADAAAALVAVAAGIAAEDAFAAAVAKRATCQERGSESTENTHAAYSEIPYACSHPRRRMQ